MEPYGREWRIWLWLNHITTPYPKEALGEGFGIRLPNSNKATVLDNHAINNTGAGLSWYGKGENRFQSNACVTATHTGACMK